MTGTSPRTRKMRWWAASAAATVDGWEGMRAMMVSGLGRKCREMERTMEERQVTPSTGAV
jgi:hypothetical protein